MYAAAHDLGCDSAIRVVLQVFRELYFHWLKLSIKTSGIEDARWIEVRLQAFMDRQQRRGQRREHVAAGLATE
jgi:hypothetical protein